MSMRERTRQQLDPAGTVGVRMFTVLVMVGALLYAVVVTLQSLREISDPAATVLALCCLSLAVALVAIGSSPVRAPFSRRSHLVVEGLVLASVFLCAAGSWGVNAFVRDDWGPVVLGLLFVAMGPYRPAGELAAAGVVSAIFVGFLVLVELPWFVTAAPPVAFVLVAVTPSLAMCSGAVAYSLGFVSAIESWRRRAGEASAGLMRELRGGIARSVQQDRVTILGRDVLPFFADVLSRGEITDADRERARQIAGSIRGVMVADAERSWLEGVADLELGAVSVVHDRDRLSTSMTTQQRTAVRALLVALAQTPEFSRDELRIRLSRDGELCRVVVAARLDSSDVVPRLVFAPYFALMRSTFEGFDVDFDRPSLRLRFWYEQH